MSSFFTVLHNSKRSKARVGEINTAHGIIKTPAFVPVGTKGTLKGLTPQQVASIPVQIAFVNTYHLVLHPGVDVLYEAGGIHKLSRLPIPLMSDSAGFQVFSLAGHTRKARTHTNEEEPLVVKIHEDGVVFRSTYDGSIIEFTPEKSMQYQHKIGADIMMAFDECTNYASSYEYTKKAMERTHDWLKRCVSYVKSSTNLYGYQQYLYGIIQGGAFQDLRTESAKFTLEQDTPGIAIGSVANGGESKKQLREQVGFVADYLPHNKPIHLLGIGHFDDIFDMVSYGVDTFDCVEPSRLARMGVIYDINADANLRVIARELDLTKLAFKHNMEQVSMQCDCYVCANFTKAYLHHLFKQKELLGYTLATYHNLHVMEKFMETLRESIVRDEI